MKVYPMILFLHAVFSLKWPVCFTGTVEKRRHLTELRPWAHQLILKIRVFLWSNCRMSLKSVAEIKQQDQIQGNYHFAKILCSLRGLKVCQFLPEHENFILHRLSRSWSDQLLISPSACSKDVATRLKVSQGENNKSENQSAKRQDNMQVRRLPVDQQRNLTHAKLAKAEPLSEQRN